MSRGDEPVVETQLPVAEAAERLILSDNVCDQRKGRDLKRLMELSTSGRWAGRFAPGALAPIGRQRTLALVAALQVNSLAWDGRPFDCDRWEMVIALPHHYPLAIPHVRFVGQVLPYNPHVLHRDHLPGEEQLPAELRPYIAQMRQGYDGGCCYMDWSQWTVSPQFDLALVVWQVSLILTGARIHAEQAALNNHARDYYLRLAEQGRLPLGPALPAPVLDELLAADVSAAPLNDPAVEWHTESDDVQWVEEETER